MTDLPFTQIREAGNLVYVSGKIEMRPDGKLVEGSIAEKTAQAMRNVLSELTKINLDASNIVFVQGFLTDMKDYVEFNEEYVKHLVKPYPARAVVAVKELPLGAKVEIIATAAKDIK